MIPRFFISPRTAYAAVSLLLQSRIPGLFFESAEGEGAVECKASPLSEVENITVVLGLYLEGGSFFGHHNIW